MKKIDSQPLQQPEEAAQGAVKEFLQTQFKGMSDDMADLWARAIAAEERENTETTEMAPAMSDHVQKAREDAKALLRQGKEVIILRSFRKSLQENNYFEAMAFMDDAKKLGIDLTGVLRETPTNMDIDSLKNGMIPLSAIS